MSESTRPFRIVVADDHAVTRQGIRLLVSDIEDAEIVGEAATGAEAVSGCRELKPDLVLMDLDMPELGGKEAIEQIRAEMPEVAVLVLTVHEDGEAVFDAIRAGASGYLSKASSMQDLREAFGALRQGGAFMTPKVAGTALGYLSRKAEETHKSVTGADKTTPREREILELLGRGLSARRIASRLGISERTVNTHVGHIYRRLGVNNRVDAIREGMRLGLVESPS